MTGPARTWKLAGVAVVPLLAGAIIVGCGGDDDQSAGGSTRSAAGIAAEQTATDSPVASISGALHVHGLGVNPAGGELLIATHNGLWSVPPGASEAESVGDSRDDFMGFAVVGPDRLLSSGHPGTGSDQPPLLGLLGSSDGGGSWRSISLSGQADLHVLRANGNRVYGVDSSSGSFLVSNDGGNTWLERSAPAPVIDLAIAPDNPERLVASTQSGLFRSSDGGRKWSRLAADRVGLLTWPEKERLLLVDAGGEVLASADGGGKFRPSGAIGATPEALGSGEGRIFVAVGGGRVLASTDGGRNWTPAVEPR
jgi:hypothetical protein